MSSDLTFLESKETAEYLADRIRKKMARLTAALRDQTQQSAKLERMIWENLKDLGYGA